MSQKVGKHNNKVYRLVLTGGPCGGKTTGQARLCTFFENLGWKVYRVPETATVLLGGGVKFTDLEEEEVYRFQENLIRTMMQIEETFFDLAATCAQNCLVICDRGVMDASSYLKPEQWKRMKVENRWNDVELRDQRYNQVVHMVSAAKGAEIFYSTSAHVVRHENLELARQLDELASQAWVGHPYYDVIDNTTDFEAKLTRMISTICNRLGVDAGDRLALNSKKRKFLVHSLPEELGLLGEISVSHLNIKDDAGIEVMNSYPQFQDFIVVHDYLVTPNSRMQARIRRRGQNVRWDNEKKCWDLETDNRYQVSCIAVDDPLQSRAEVYMYGGTDQDITSHWTYTHTIRRPEINKTSIETRMQISSREYRLLLAQRDQEHYTVYKKRRCFLWNNQYFQMDIYQQPCHPRCEGLILLETYTTMKGEELKLPSFLDIDKEVTDDRGYSMYNLSKRELIPAKIDKLLGPAGNDKDEMKKDASTKPLVNGTSSSTHRD